LTITLFFFRVSTSGGAERSICWLANELVVRGFVVYLITLDDPSESSFFKLHSSVNWIKLGFRPGIIGKVQRLIRIVSALKKNKTRILIGFVVSADRVIYAAAKIARVKLIVAERNAPSMYKFRYNFFQRIIIYKFLQLADCITVQFPDYIQQYPKNLWGRIECIHNVINFPENFSTPQKPNEYGRYVLLSVSRFEFFQKRIDLLIGAFAMVQERYPLWDLIIIGEGPQGCEIECQIKQLNLIGRVQLKSAKAALADAYLTANLFAIPSRWEGFPNALAEAQSYGLPAVGFSNSCGVFDLIGSNKSGWLVDGIDNDLDAFAMTLNEAMAHNNERRIRGLFAKKNMMKYGSDNQAEKWVSVSNSLAQN
jgi:GalNAc-alpha-(1->4)-GalNAc-alpha-(1->3)-diNAcBac-PP-undecaprenol alpha-1,4-N-acetyl-D-galactosaminyltransferase